ncbi:MAG TPA: carboxypeptidase-like regulatory domain-containing protein, partial [Candidatus Acidoferrum sp.]|nr:carboxypeptidase-like regulatory domain-containing protein [Candidatus Acidoferrum sp.]
MLGNSIRSRSASSAALVILSFLLSTASAQQAPPAQIQALPATPDEPEGATVSAEGVVHTSDGSPIPGATIRLVNTDTQKAWVTWTDVFGKFDFPAVPPGHYTATATQLGFQQASAEEHLSPGASSPMELVLRVSTLAELSGPSPGQERFGGHRFGGGQHGGPGAPPDSANASDSSGRGRAGRGQLPPGVLNAVQQGLANGGFQQTDVTGEVGASSEEASVPGGAGLQPNANLSTGAGSSSDAFLLQGTVGQGLSPNAGGPIVIGQGGFDQGLGPGGANLPGVAGMQGPGGPGGGPGGGPFGAGGFGGGNALFVGRGGGGPGGGGGGGGG